MGLSKLDNIIKSLRGTILYVDPNNLNATDSIENQGTSPNIPFRTIQRALVESSRISYQRGINNDRFNKTTILLYPGDHIVDNRPGYIANEDGSFSTLGNSSAPLLEEWTLSSNFDLSSTNNELYKLNSIYGGVIVPRGTSIVGMDLRKTKIRPTFVPDPENSNIERTAIFRVTGGCYFWQFTILDADPNGTCFKNYTTSKFTPNFSHHKLTSFEYADGVNPIDTDTNRTDLDVYYEKIALVYGPNAGDRNITFDPNYSSDPVVDIQPIIDEYRIVGPGSKSVGISSVTVSGTTVTVTTQTDITEINVNSPIQINGVDNSPTITGFDGQFLVNEIFGPNLLSYKTPIVPVSPTASFTPSGNATLSLEVDTVNSASPYIFNISLRSVYGMCGLHADGDKATGFKSMVVAQFTGIGLQKDDNAFVIYDKITGSYLSTAKNKHSNSNSVFRPEYENYHIKVSNNAFIQLVSVFAIGYAKHFVADTGGDLSITNSNSNFGAKSLISKGFRKNAFIKDDVGYITHIIPPREIETPENTINFLPIDVGLTTSVGNSKRLYLYNQNNLNNVPSHVIDGYRIGARNDDKLFVTISDVGITTEYSTRIVMSDTEVSTQKTFNVAKLGLENDIVSHEIKLTSVHNFTTGEKVRVVSDNGYLPDGLDVNQIYYVITTGNTSKIKLAQTYSNAFLGTFIELNSKGGNLKVVSKIIDKNPGDIGHPIQWDNTNSNWYINVETSSSIYNIINTLGESKLGDATSRTYIKRYSDNRSNDDKIYKFRYVIPKEVPNARTPLDGYIIQESNNLIGIGNTEVEKYFNPSTVEIKSTDLRNPRFIADATWSTNTANIFTELSHDLRIGSEVEVFNVTSTNNPTGIANSSYNGTFVVTGIQSSRHFSFSLDSDPGSFTNDTTVRNSDLPSFRRKSLNTILQIYSSDEIQKHIKDKQDGVYHLIVNNSSNKPVVSPFDQLNFSQPIQNLYPQTNRDNPNSDPDFSTSHALSSPIGQVVIDHPENSITKETLIKTLSDFNIGNKITNIVSNPTGTAHTIFTQVDHGLSGIRTLSIVSGGSNYIPGTYYAANLVGFAGSSTGKNANAIITVGLGNTVTSVRIMEGGSAYGIGNTLSIIPAAGIGTTTGFVPAVVQVTGINDNIGDVLSIIGIGGSLTQYNELYRVTGVSTENQIQVASASTITPSVSTISSPSLVSSAVLVSTGKVLNVSSFVYNSTTGIATVGFTTNHGLQVDYKLKIGGVSNDYFNKNVIVKKINTLTSVDIFVGKEGAGLSTSGTIFGYKNDFSSKGGLIGKENEILSNRPITKYDRITTTISSQILSTDEQISIPNATTSGLKVGDYIQIDREIFRIKTTITTNAVEVHRALFGTPRETHIQGSVVRKIRVIPVELRRNSIIRASAHTFEYIGYGPGNYSTAFPEQQDRQLSTQEEQLAQVTRIDGGVVNFTAMNSNGDFYSGNKKINSTTGQEETYDTPIPNVSGEEKTDYGTDVTTSSEIYVDRSIKVEGGTQRNLISEFGGPVVFNERVKSNSDKGVEVKTLFIQGNEEVARNFSISTSIPTIAGNYGDIVTRANPKLGQNVGWVYTTDNDWKYWGSIKNEEDPIYAVGVSSNKGPVGLSSLIDFVGTGVSVSVTYDSTSGISTVLVKGDPVNYIGIVSESSFIGLATSINFVGEDDGFGMTVNVDFNPTSGIATVILGTPINVVNFGTGLLGYASPSFATTSVGTRIVYENRLNSTNTNYAVGIGADDSLWWSVPQNNSYSFKWYGGESEIAQLSSEGSFSVLGDSLITAGRFISTITTGTSPFQVQSQTLVDNLNSQYLDGYVSAATTTPDTIVRRDSSNNINGNVSHLRHNVSGPQRGEWYADIPGRLGYTPFNKAGDTCTGVSTFQSATTFNDLVTIKKVSDIFVNRTTDVTGTLSCDFNDGPISRTTNTNTTIIDITNVPTTDSRALNYTVLMNAASAVSNLANIQFRINGTTLNTGGNTIRWLNNITPTGINAGYYFFGFSIFRVGSVWEVLGVFAIYA